jgi:hypothetical protein
LYGKDLPKDYAGEPMEATLMECSKKYNILYKVFAIKILEDNSGTKMKEDNSDTKIPKDDSERQYEQISSFRPSCFDNFDADEDDDKLVENYNNNNQTHKIKICNLLLLSGYEEKYLMYIIDFEKFTKCHVCPKCGNYSVSTANHCSYNKKRYAKHVATCTGKSQCNV